MRSRAVSEDDAKAAMDTFENVLAGPFEYKGAHLCLAEVFLMGSAPQLGRDDRRALVELISFLEASTLGGGSSRFEAGLLNDVVHAASEAAMSLDAGGIAPLATRLLRLAGHIPSLRGSAVRACLARLERIDGHPRGDGSPAPGEAPASSASPMDLIDGILGDLVVAKRENAMLKSQLKEERGQRVLLADQIDEANAKRNAAEELMCRFSASAERVHHANERLAERIEGEILRADKAERSAQVAEADAEELRRECQRLRRESDHGRRGASVSDWDISSKAAMPMTARASPAPRGEGTVSLTPRPAAASQVMQGYTSERHTTSPAPPPTPSMLDGYSNSRRAPATPAPRDSCQMSSRPQGIMQFGKSDSPRQHESPFSSVRSGALRDVNGLRDVNIRPSSRSAKRSDSDRGYMSSAGLRVLTPRRSDSENVFA